MVYNEILDKTRKIAGDIVAGEVHDCDRNYTWHERGMRAMQQAGLGGLVVGTECGGMGHGLVALAHVCEILGRESASMGICFGMHCVGAAVIASKATDYHIKHYLKPICEGEHITALALSEPGTGAHFYYPETTLLAENSDSFRVNGIKTFITNGNHADSYVVSTVAADPDAPIGHFSCIILDKDMKGMRWKDSWTGIGMRGNSSLTLEMKEVKIPASNLLGEEGDQIWYIFNVVAPYFLIAMAGTYLGLAQAAFDEARANLTKRMHAHSGMTLDTMQLLQHRLGTLWSHLERTRRLIYWAASEADLGGEMAIPALCSSKADVARCAVELVNEAMTLCGGIGYRQGGNLERLMRDVRAADVMSPTTDLLYTWIGRALLEQPILD